MNNQEYQAYCEFISKVLYELTTIDDYEIILRELDIPIKSRNRSSNHWRLLTGCHNATYSGVHANLDFNTENRSFTCFSHCNCSYNLLTLTEQRFKILGEQKSRFACLKWICERLDIPFNFKDDVERDRKNIYNWKSDLLKYIKNKKEIIEEKIYDKEILQYFPKIYHESWLDFGISIETMDKYNIRYYPYRDQIIIPVYSESNLVGIRIRNINPDDAEMEGKYRPLKLLDGEQFNFPTDKYFYGMNYVSNEIRRTKTCILVEGEKSVLKSDTWFGDNSITVAMFGHKLSNEKLKYLINLGCENVIIAIDWDYIDKDSKEYEKYVDQVNKIYFKCRPYMKNIYVMVNPNEHNEYYKCNPFDLEKDQYRWFWENKELIE